MLISTSSTSRTTENWAEAYGREGELETAKWERALAIAGYTGNNIEKLKPRNTTPALEAAMTLAIFRDWKVFPADVEAKKSYLSAEFAPGGKNWGMTSDPEQLRRNFVNPKWRLKCGVGVPTGAVNGIFDIEADTPKGHGVDGLASLRELEGEHGKLPDTLMAESPSGSVHRIYRHPGRGIKIKSSDNIVPGVDIKGDGGMFVAPPSVRHDGSYRWLNNLPIADAPGWLLALVTEEARDHGNGSGDLNWAEEYGYELHEPVPVNKVAFMLGVIPNSVETGREHWVRVGHILKYRFPDIDGHFDPEGVRLFKEWSQRWDGVLDEDFDEKQYEEYIIKRWRGFKSRGDATIGSLFYLADKYDPDWRNRYDAEREGAAASPQQEAKPHLIIPGFSADWCDVTKIPMRHWLYGQHYIRGFATTSIAPGGVGKSTLAIIEGICMASGRSLLSVPVEERIKVWYWNGEEPRHEIARRVHAVCQHYKTDPRSIADTFHFTSGLDEFPIKLVTATKSGITVDKKLFADIVAFIQVNDIAVMLIDPFISSHGVPENDNVAIDVVAKSWGRIAALTNCNIDLVHHTRKALRGNEEGETYAADARGAGSLIDAVRGSRVFNQMTEKEAGEFGVEDRFDYFRVNRGKVNMTRRGASAWYKLVSVVIGNGPFNYPEEGDNVQTVEDWTPPDVLSKVTVQHMHTIKTKAAGGEYLRDSRAKEGWIGMVVAEIMDLDPVKQRAQIEQVLKLMVSIDALKEVKRKDKKSMERTFVEPGPWTG